MNRTHLSKSPLFVAAAAVALLFAGCSSPNNSSAGSSGPFELNTDDCIDPAAATAEVTDTWNIGWSLPLSGPVAGVVAPAVDGWEARIQEANENDELDGVQVDVQYLDDGFSPDRTKTNTTQFIQKEKVDSLNAVGSGGTGAMADDQNAACVPLLYATSAADQYRSLGDYPWTIQYSPSATNETKYDVSVIQSRFPDGATVAIAENQTATGKAITDSFNRAVEGTDIDVVLTTPLTDPNAAATNIKSKKPDVVLFAASAADCSPMATALGRVGFKAELVIAPGACVDTTGWVASGAGGDGVVVPSWIKNVEDPASADDPDVKAFLAATEDLEDAANPQVALGWILADLTIETLKRAQASSDGLSRASAISAARDMEYQVSMTVDGIKWVSTPTEMLGWNAFQTRAWDAGEQEFVDEGDLVPIGD